MGRKAPFFGRHMVAIKVNNVELVGALLAEVLRASQSAARARDDCQYDNTK